MPGFKRKYIKRKGGKRYRPKRKITVSALNTVGPLPPRYLTTMKYSETFSLNTINGYQYKYNLNSLWDPNRSGVGHQPYGFDQLATLYNRYRVISTSFVLDGIQSDSPGTNIRLACQPSNEDITYANLSAMCEAPRTRFVVQGAQGAPLKTLKGKINLASLMGRTKTDYMADDRYSADVNQSPAEFAVLNIMSGTLNDGGATVNVVITMEFTVEWYDIRQVAQS